MDKTLNYITEVRDVVTVNEANALLEEGWVLLSSTTWTPDPNRPPEYSFLLGLDAVQALNRQALAQSR